jgi:hypothetical protein
VTRRHRPMDTDTRSHLAELRRSRRGNSAAQVRARQHAAAQAEADAWNAAHPIGTEVTVTMDLGEVRRTRTRSIAWRICDHASVMVEGISGGYLLSRVKAVAGPVLRVVSEPVMLDRVDLGGEAG